MSKFKLVTGFIVVAMLTGCASGPSSKVDANHALTVDANKTVALAKINKKQEPLFTMKAVPGQTIKLEGVSELTVYAPDTSANSVSPAIAQYQPQQSEGYALARSALGVLGPVLGVWAGGQAAIGLADAVGNAATRGYSFVQAPQPNMTIGGSGVIGSGTMTTNTLSGTGVVGDGTMTTNTLAGTGTMGAGGYTTNALSGTGTLGGGSFSDTHPVDNHTVTGSNNPLTCTTGPC